MKYPFVVKSWVPAYRPNFFFKHICVRRLHLEFGACLVPPPCELPFRCEDGVGVMWGEVWWGDARWGEVMCGSLYVGCEVSCPRKERECVPSLTRDDMRWWWCVIVCEIVGYGVRWHHVRCRCQVVNLHPVRPNAERSHLTSSTHHTTPHITSHHLTLPHIHLTSTSPHTPHTMTHHHLTSPHITSPHLTSPHIHLTSTSPHTAPTMTYKHLTSPHHNRM